MSNLLPQKTETRSKSHQTRPFSKNSPITRKKCKTTQPLFRSFHRHSHPFSTQPHPPREKSPARSAPVSGARKTAPGLKYPKMFQPQNVRQQITTTNKHEKEKQKNNDINTEPTPLASPPSSTATQTVSPAQRKRFVY